MAKLVLFESGDGGGLLITQNAVRVIPPFDPSVRTQIKAVSQLVVAIQDQLAGGSARGELTALATRLSNLAIQQVEAIVGNLDTHASLIVVNEADGGFVCGTTGEVPVLLPRPSREVLPLDSVLARGGIDRTLLTLAREAAEHGRSVNDLLEHPAEVARELGVELSDRSARALQVLAPSRVDELEDPVVREVVTFFHRVLTDGRYVDTWAIRPGAVAQDLDVQLSDDALERIISVGALLPRQPGPPGVIWLVAIGAGVVLGVVLTVVTEDDAEVVDRSGRSKF